MYHVWNFNNYCLLSVVLGVHHDNKTIVVINIESSCILRDLD